MGFARWPSIVWISAAICISADIHARNQQPNQAPVFSSRTDLVRLSVSVTDNKTGRPVTALTARDFTVSDNGVPQQISTFAREADQAEVTSDNRRVFLIVFGFTGRVEGPVKPFEGALGFLRTRLLPTDLVAVMAFNRMTSLTDDHEQLARLVERIKERNSSLWFSLQLDTRPYSRADVGDSVETEIDKIFEITPTASRNVTAMLLGLAVFRQNDDTLRPWNRLVITRDLLKVYAGIEYLRQLTGEKHLILFRMGGLTPPPIRFLGSVPVGMYVDSRQDDERLAARANDAHVALDIINTEGVSTGQEAGIASLETIAEYSGGHYTGVSTADTALATIDDATRNSYLIGYRPANAALDARYHNVTVKVNRKGVTVAFPHGYTARREPPPLDLREIETRERLRDAAATDVVQNDIGVKGRASLVSTSRQSQVRVEMTIDATKLTLKKINGNWEGTIDLLILCGDAKQRLVGSVNQQMKVTLDAAHYQQAMTTGIPRVELVPVTGPVGFVKILVYDYDADRLGSAYITLK